MKKKTLHAKSKPPRPKKIDVVSSIACVLNYVLTYFPGGPPSGSLLRKHKKKFRVCISVTHCAF